MSNASSIHKSTRLAIFLRDGLTCVYCQQSAPAIRLTLDHVNEQRLDLESMAAPGRHKTLKNHPSVLITACYSCNSSKKGRSVSAFCLARGLSKGVVWKRIRAQTSKPIAPYRDVVNLLIERGTPPWLEEIWSGHVKSSGSPDLDDSDIPF